jgi:hypothetical protein
LAPRQPEKKSWRPRPAKTWSESSARSAFTESRAAVEPTMTPSTTPVVPTTFPGTDHWISDISCSTSAHHPLSASFCARRTSFSSAATDSGLFSAPSASAPRSASALPLAARGVLGRGGEAAVGERNGEGNACRTVGGREGRAGAEAWKPQRRGGRGVGSRRRAVIRQGEEEATRARQSTTLSPHRRRRCPRDRHREAGILRVTRSSSGPQAHARRRHLLRRFGPPIRSFLSCQP